MEKFTDQQLEFIKIHENGTKLTDLELEAKFGCIELQNMRDNLSIQREIANRKIARSERKHLIEEFKLKETVEAQDLALQTLISIMHNGKEHNRLQAAQTLIKPTISTLEKHGIAVTEIELTGDTSERQQFVLNVSKIDGSKAN